MPLIHQIEDLQFICFALVFGIMTLLARGEKTIRYVWFSYVLAMAVSVVDALAAQPLSLFTNAAILSILTLRNAVLAAAIASFTREARRLAWVCLGIVGLACCALVGSKAGLSRATLLSFYYLALAAQLLLLCAILVRSREASTRVPRWLLAFLFLLSAAYRINQMAFVLSRKTPHDIWMRDQGLFLNSTILGCLLPFTIVWMMNARDHAILLEQAIIDPLTNLLNRRGLAEAASRELARYARSRQDFAVAVADLDHFKALNDSYGHAFGDEVLASTARLLREELRQTDIVARSGGEEFVLLLPLTSDHEMVTVLERARALLERLPLQHQSGATPPVTISIGVTNTRGRNGLTWTDLHDEADSALYAAKQAGRNRIACATLDQLQG